MDTMASMMLAHFCLKFTDMLLFTLCIVACVHISNIEVFETDTKDTCINVLFTFFCIFM